jgi:4-hydroxy-tetrahydrodipicolinate synthase
MLKDTLPGTGVALVTPFNQNGAIDFPALERTLDFVIKGGVNYIVSLGTTGETPVLSRQEKIDILECTYQVVSGRVPVMVGSGGNDTRAVIDEIESLPLDKAIAVLSASPYYNKPSQEGIFLHYKEIAKASPRPVILYNVPGRTGSNISAETTVRLARDVANIQGIKEASGNMAQCQQILRDAPADFLVTSGDDALALAQIACGMDGVISVAANCFPKEFCRMVQCALNNDYASARALNNKLIRGYDLLFAENNPAGAKAFMSLLGILQNQLRLPLVPLSNGLQEQASAYLQQLHETGIHA